MNGLDERRRRVMITQGVAALACFLIVHGAHAATVPAVKATKAGHAVIRVDAAPRR